MHTKCQCLQCIKDHDLRGPGGILPLSMTQMTICPTCGNNRCPKAHDHRNTCTGSNDPWQGTSLRNVGPAKQSTLTFPPESFYSRDSAFRAFQRSGKPLAYLNQQGKHVATLVRGPKGGVKTITVTKVKP